MDQMAENHANEVLELTAKIDRKLKWYRYGVAGLLVVVLAETIIISVDMVVD
jgi:hypothetical protein